MYPCKSQCVGLFFGVVRELDSIWNEGLSFIFPKPLRGRAMEIFCALIPLDGSSNFSSLFPISYFLRDCAMKDFDGKGS